MNTVAGGPRIAVVAEHLHRQPAGGVGRYTIELIRALSSVGVAVRVVSSMRGSSVLSQIVDSRLVSRVDVSLLEMGSIPLPHRVAVEFVHRGLPLPGWSRAVGTSSLVHAASPDLPSAASPGAPFTAFVHDTLWRDWPEAYSQRGRVWHERSLQRTVRGARAIAVPSEAVRQAVLDAGASNDQTVLMGEGADHLTVIGGDHRQILLAVATHQPRKNLMLLLDAYRRYRSQHHSPLPLRIAGAPGWGATPTHERVDGVEWLGSVTDLALSRLYSEAAAVVMPSLAEGYGLPVLEAWRAGCPVVASVGVPLANEHREAAFVVDPQDRDGLAALMQQLSDRPESAEDRVGAGRRIAHAATWKSVALRHLAMWDAVTEAEVARSPSRSHSPSHNPSNSKSDTGHSLSATAPSPALRCAVVIDASAVHPRSGGAGTYLRSVVPAVIAQHAPVSEGSLPSASIHLVTRRSDASWDSLAGDAVAVHRVAPDRRVVRLVWEHVGLARVIRSIPGETVVLHSPHYTTPARLEDRVARVVTVHDLTFFSRPQDHQRSKVRFFQRALRRTANLADIVVCVSHTTADALRSWTGRDVGVVVAPHGVSPLWRQGSAADRDRDWGLVRAAGVHEQFVLHLGAIEPRKRIDTLIRAHGVVRSRRDGLDLVLAGEPWAHMESILPVAGSHEHRLGFVSAELALALVRCSAVVVYPSAEEGFGLPMLEAMAAGTPVVAADTPISREVCGNAAVLVGESPARDVQSFVDGLADGIEQVLAMSESDRDPLVVSAMRRAQEFSWERSAAAHLDAYARAQRFALARIQAADRVG